MFDLSKIFGKRNTELPLSKDEIAELLQVNKDYLDKFEASYKTFLEDEPKSEELFDINSRQASENMGRDLSAEAEDIANRTVAELLALSYLYVYDGERGYVKNPVSLLPSINKVSIEEVKKLPEAARPNFTATAISKDIAGDSYPMLLMNYKSYLDNIGTPRGEQFYHMFRQGLDILDLDPIMYEIIGMNENSMGNWLPQLVEGKGCFFKIPKTKILKVPLPVLQLTRNDYMSLTPTTLRIVDDYCRKVFELDLDKEYFIKTGTYSSKFDFRNAYIHDPKEVRELGEYLLYIHFQALQMASPLCTPCVYGVSTTNEWVVREFIADKENNPSIYKGLPLHAEYRVFVDFDTDEVLGIAPYWEPNTMKTRFADGKDADSPHQMHDYIIYKAHENTLMDRYSKNKNMVVEEIRNIIPNIDLKGQWSIDIMQNGDDFWIIDMALAYNSALKEFVEPSKLKKPVENWLPKLN